VKSVRTAVAAMRSSSEDQHFIKLLRMSDMNESKYVLKMFPDTGFNFVELKTLIVQNDSSGRR